MAVKSIPDGYHTVTPYLIVNGAAAAIDYYRRAFGARELMRFPGPDGRLAHAEIQIGGSRIMLGDVSPEMRQKDPKSIGGSSTGLMLYVDDVDRVFMQAIEAGGHVRDAVKDQFYGDRSGSLEDPFGHMWTVATHVEDVSESEMKRRMAQMSHA
jgi:PhnB protein